QLIEENNGRTKTFLQDYSIVLLTIEELVATGAMELALDMAESDFPTLTERIPEPLRTRIAFVGDQSLRSAVAEILSPTYEEFGVESDPGGYSLIFSKPCAPEVSDHIGEVWSTLYTFLLGARNYLQIDIDLRGFLFATNALRLSSRNPKARANL